MRPLSTILLANLSICGATPSAPASAPAVVVPSLRQELSVARRTAAAGEPIALVGGEKMMCAIRKDAASACIGEVGLALTPVDLASDDGRYSRTHAERPVAIEGVELRHLEATAYTRCIYTPGDGPVECWARDVAQRQGQYPEPLSFRDVSDVGADDQTCVIDKAGSVRCSGGHTCFGEEHALPVFDPTRPLDVPGIDRGRLVARAPHMGCVVRQDSTVACWGKILEDAECTPEAAVVPGLDQVVDVAVGNYSACALRADNRVLCWGNNSGQTLGVREPRYSATPIEVPGTHPAVKLASISRGFAVLQVDGSVVAWGSSLLLDEKVPPVRLDLARPALDFVVLQGMVCALLDTGDVECEGYNLDLALEEGRPRPPFEGKAPWVEAPLYRLTPRPAN